jgi:hypothetical protein
LHNKKRVCWNVLESEIMSIKEPPRERWDKGSLLSPTGDQILGKKRIRTTEEGREQRARMQRPNPASWDDLHNLKVLFPLSNLELAVSLRVHQGNWNLQGLSLWL